MTPELKYEYKRQRAHQRAVCSMITVYPSGRTELSWASAPYGEHALSAFIAARRHIYFVRRILK